MAVFIGLPVKKAEILTFYCCFRNLLGRLKVTLLGTDFAII